MCILGQKTITKHNAALYGCSVLAGPVLPSTTKDLQFPFNSELPNSKEKFFLVTSFTSTMVLPGNAHISTDKIVEESLESIN